MPASPEIRHRREPIRFFLPGPVYVLEEVRQALTAPILGHRSPAFRQIYQGLAERLPRIFRTAGDVYVATGSATLVMELAVISTVRRRVLNLTCGAFSERWHVLCRSLGKEADTLAFPWGRAVDPDVLRQALRRAAAGGAGYEAVTVVQNETSTGVISPIAEIARVVREESDALVLVDAVSSLGGAPFETDAWGVDLVLVGGQKALALPPGLVLFAASERALERAAAVPHRGFYTDLLRYRDRHRKEGEGGTITTPAIPLIYALALQAERILAEGVEERWRRHERLRRKTATWAEEHGLEFAAAADCRSPTVSCLAPPPGLDAPELVRRLAERGFTVAGGYGAWKATTFRIGHMGEVAEADLDDLFRAIESCCPELRLAGGVTQSV